jgi:hypothetical protein
LKEDNMISNEWLSVIGRSLAFLCLVKASIRDKDLATQARFLIALGLSRKEVATLLGTSEGSLKVSLHHASKKKGGKRGSTKKR